MKQQRLESQLRQAEKEKERLVKEKAEQEARLRHQMQEQLKEARDKAEEQMRETVQENGELKRELSELRQTQKTEKTGYLRKISQAEKSIQIMQVDVMEKDGTIQKLRELVEQRDRRIEGMTREVETMQTRLLQVQDALHEAR